MKKVLILLLLFTVFMACSDDDDNGIKLDKTEIELLSDGTYTITATSDNTLTYKSNNEYIATVSNTGIISAKRIGDAKITVSDGQHEGNITVKVNPKYSLYPDPFIEFGTLKSTIIAKFGAPDSESSSGIGYKNYSIKAPMVMYLFDNDNKLEAVGIMVKTDYSSELGAFLAERYVLVDYLPESYTIAMVNGLDKENITMMVGATIYNSSYWVVNYIPFSLTKAVAAPTPSFNELVENMQ